MPCRFRRRQMPRARLRASGPLGQLPSRLSDRHARGFTSAAATCQPSEFEKARGSLPAASRLTGENGLAAGAKGTGIRTFGPLQDRRRFETALFASAAVPVPPGLTRPRSRASLCRSWSRRSRARLTVARNSQSLAACSSAMLRGLRYSPRLGLPLVRQQLRLCAGSALSPASAPLSSCCPDLNAGTNRPLSRCWIGVGQ